MDTILYELLINGIEVEERGISQDELERLFNFK